MRIVLGSWCVMRVVVACMVVMGWVERTTRVMLVLSAPTTMCRGLPPAHHVLLEPLPTPRALSHASHVGPDSEDERTTPLINCVNSVRLEKVRSRGTLGTCHVSCVVWVCWLLAGHWCVVCGVPWCGVVCGPRRLGSARLGSQDSHNLRA